jgi:triacylglycerol esterase/lipase EstA (alpha/beta hydrolase family)
LTAQTLLVTFFRVLALRVLLAYAVTVVAGAGSYVLISYLLAFARPSARPPGRLFRAMAVELLTTLVVLPMWPLFLLLGASYELYPTTAPSARGALKRPVVLLHGLAMNRTQWMWMGRSLARRGIGPSYGMTYFSLQSVSRSARHLDRFVARLLRREGAAQVDIVAHSLGGLVARYYVERLGGAPHVGRIITIASPHHGTALGRLLAIVPSARETLRDSRLLGDLGPLTTGAAGVRYTSIWSRADAIIVPPESSSIAPAGDDQVYEDLGHLSLIFSPRVVDVVAARLAA